MTLRGPRFIAGTTATLTQTQFQAGSGASIPGITTDVVAPVTHGSKKIDNARRASGFDTVVEVDGRGPAQAGLFSGPKVEPTP